MAEPFTSKTVEFMRITVPTRSADKTPGVFCAARQAVHENQYGKGLWAKIPADGKTTVTKPTLMGQDDAEEHLAGCENDVRTGT